MSRAGPGGGAVIPRSSRIGHLAFRDVHLLGLLAILAALLVVFSLASPYFLSVRNLTNVLLSVSVIGTMAAISTLLIVSGALDLSVGSTAALVGVTVAGLLGADHGVAFAVAGGLGVGALCGLCNGLLVVRLGINPIIATIGTLSVFRGVAYIITDGQTVEVTNGFVLALGSGRVFGVPWAALLMIGIFILCHLFATYMRIGRTLFAIGSNARASYQSGISLGRYRAGIFLASGVSAAVAAVLLLGQSATAVPAAGVGYELLVITAVLIGGTSLAGGEGNVLGTLLGVLVIGVLNNGMTLLGVSSYYQTVLSGVLLLGAVALDRRRHVN
jgi:ribose/xylose/arabinose/galactoside ABC-type transport system permease subunit